MEILSPPRPADLLRRANQALSSIYDSKAEDGISLAKVAVLATLHRHGSCNLRRLVAFTGIDRSTMSELVQRLVAAGLVIAVGDPDDARAKIVSLTGRGARTLIKAEPPLWDAEVKMMARLTPVQRGAFLKCLEIVAFATSDERTP